MVCWVVRVLSVYIYIYSIPIGPCDVYIQSGHPGHRSQLQCPEGEPRDTSFLSPCLYSRKDHAVYRSTPIIYVYTYLHPPKVPCTCGLNYHAIDTNRKLLQPALESSSSFDVEQFMWETDFLFLRNEKNCNLMQCF